MRYYVFMQRSNSWECTRNLWEMFGALLSSLRYFSSKKNKGFNVNRTAVKTVCESPRPDLIQDSKGINPAALKLSTTAL